MEDWQKRVIDELTALRDKIEKLRAAPHLSADPLLRLQLASMETYAGILAIRIDRFSQT